MDWFFDNLGKFIPIVLGLFYFIASLKKGGEQEEADKSPEAQERARKIQEEIRRKILERQGGGAAQAERSTIEPKPSIEFWEEEEDYNPMVPETVREKPRSAPVFVPERTQPNQADLYEAQRLETERKLEDVRAFKHKLALKKAEQSRRAAPELKVSSQRSKKQVSSLKDSLKGRQSLRKAIKLKEILGEPVALRGN